MFSLVKMWFLVFSGRNLSHHRRGQFCETLRFLSRPSNCFFYSWLKKPKKNPTPLCQSSAHTLSPTSLVCGQLNTSGVKVSFMWVDDWWFAKWLVTANRPSELHQHNHRRRSAARGVSVKTDGTLAARQPPERSWCVCLCLCVCWLRDRHRCEPTDVAQR